MVGLEILDGLSTVLRCSLKRSVSHRLVSPMFGAVVALYHVDGVCFLVTVRMWWVIGLVSPVEWNVYEVCPSDMYLQVRQFFPHGYKPRGWLCRVRLRSLAPTRKSLRLGFKVTSPHLRSWPRDSWNIPLNEARTCDRTETKKQTNWE